MGNRTGQISERQLRMLELRHQGMKLSEIGSLFGITAEGVRVNINLSVSLLKKHGQSALPESCTTPYTPEELCSISRGKKAKQTEHIKDDRKEIPLMNSRFIRINGKEFSFDDLAKALGVDAQQGLDPFQVQLCRRIDAGVLTASASDLGGPEYPGIDVELHLPEKADTQPIMITRTEQPHDRDVVNPVRTFSYGRNEDYFMFFDADTRTDREVEEKAIPPSVVVAGDPDLCVDVWKENSYMNYRGNLPAPTSVLQPEKTMSEKISYYRGNIAAQVIELADGGYITPAQQSYLEKHIDEITKKYIIKCDIWEFQNSRTAPLDVEMDIIHKEILAAADKAPKSLDAQISGAAERSHAGKTSSDAPVKDPER